jgi:hypothetical protein
MQILKTTLIEFDEVVERNRLKTMFKGPLKKALLAIYESFLATNWVACHELLKRLSPAELELLHPVIYDVMRERADRNHRIDALGEGAECSAALRRQLDYPRFQTGTFVD